MSAGSFAYVTLLVFIVVLVSHGMRNVRVIAPPDIIGSLMADLEHGLRVGVIECHENLPNLAARWPKAISEHLDLLEDIICCPIRHDNFTMPCRYDLAKFRAGRRLVDCLPVYPIH